MWPFGRKHPPLEERDSAGEMISILRGVVDGVTVSVRARTFKKGWFQHPELPVKLGFAIPFNNPRIDDLPPEDEWRMFPDIEDRIIEHVESSVICLYVMTITDYRMKEFVFYTMQGYDFAKLHSEVKQLITTHEVQCIAELERNWISYRQFAKGRR